VIEPQFADVGEFSEGLAWVTSFSGKFGYIDMSGKMIIKPKFDEVKNFAGGLALVAVRRKGKIVVSHGNESKAFKYGYVNSKGKYVWKQS
jgi:WG repeat protein